MGHLDVVKAALLMATLCAWVVLTRVMLDRSDARRLGNAGCIMAFLVTAGITRLTFTEVETRLQIAAFAVAAGLLVATQVRAADDDTKLGRWACCLLGTVVGAVATRELVHHCLERWL